MTRTAMLLGASGMALTIASGTAFAACAPDPNVANTQTICTGTDRNGLTLSSSPALADVTKGATVLSGRQPGAILIDVRDQQQHQVAVQIDGTVNGGNVAGVLGTDGLDEPDYGGGYLTLSLIVGKTGLLTGATGLQLANNKGYEGFSTADVTNDGRIEGASGAALVATDMRASFGTVTNKADGFIGGIEGGVEILNNAGTIDGGTGSAYASPANAVAAVDYDINVTNSGVIRSNGGASTLDIESDPPAITNTGTIQNHGTGAAITGDGATIDNEAGGTIATAGSIAISAADDLELTNRGTITGSVAAGYGMIDDVGGTIKGDVSFTSPGFDQNRLKVSAGTGANLIRGITGHISGAGGDTLEVVVSANKAISDPALPTGFSTLQLDVDAGATATISGPGVPTGGYQIAGGGAVVTTGAIAGSGLLFADGFLSNEFGYPSFDNQGHISVALAGKSDLALLLRGTVTNEGTIDASKGGAIRFEGDGTFTNSGTISADGVALETYNGFTNSGTIRSRQGVAVEMSVGADSSSNSGLIKGKTAGVEIEDTLVNTGTITGKETGALLGTFATLDNQAGGRVSGGRLGVGLSASVGNLSVLNAGTIDGGIDLSSSDNLYSPPEATIWLKPGGIVNGDLLLGRGNDIVFASADPDRTDALQGLTGRVDPGEGIDTLVQPISTDTSTKLKPFAGFEVLGYEISDGAKLTLRAKTPQTLMVAVNGTGSLDLSADLSGTAELLNLQGPTSDNVSANPVGSPDAPHISAVSRGTLTLVADGANTYHDAVDGGAADFENVGTISVTDTVEPYRLANAIRGGTNVVNSGSILLNGATGVLGSFSLTNTGSIGEIAGAAASTGVDGVHSVTNSGSIVVSDVAIRNATDVTNSGRITSTTAAAITGGYNPDMMIVNQAGGRIKGGNGIDTIDLSGGVVVNAGTISGTVNMSYYWGAGVFIDEGGTLDGNLVFGGGDDVFVARGTGTGVTGTIDPGAGTDTFVRSFAKNATTALDAPLQSGFELLGIEARNGAAVTLTTTGASYDAGLTIYGDGSVINTATITGTAYAPYYGGTPSSIVLGGNPFGPGGSELANSVDFTNAGTIAHGVQGNARNFTNTGTIGNGVDAGGGVVLYATERSFSFNNSGTISSGPPLDPLGDIPLGAIMMAPASASASPPVDLASVTVTNSGRIGNGVWVQMPATSLTATNAQSGVIDQSADASAALRLIDATANTSSVLTASNAGTIEATGKAGIGVALSAGTRANGGTALASLTNSGAITVNGGGLVSDAPNTLQGMEFGVGVLLQGSSGGATASMTNAAGGTISATGSNSVAVLATGTDLVLTNDGSITGGTGTEPGGTTAIIDGRASPLAGDYVAGAVQTGDYADLLVNRGTITGSIDLGGGDDRIENAGTINGDVFLRDGNDSFVLQAGGRVTGHVDGGAGMDTLTLDASGTAQASAVQFTNFETITAAGGGTLTLAGTVAADTLHLSGAALQVAAGTTLASQGPVTVTGSDGSEQVSNYGHIAGAVMLGAGDDTYTEGTGSTVGGTVDGGAGQDTYVVALAGDRSGIGQRTGFETVAVQGRGTLTDRLDQDWSEISLSGTGLKLSMNGHAVGAITGSDAGEQVAIDGNVARIALGGGNDRLTTSVAELTGSIDGGEGTDSLDLTAAGGVTIAGTVTGFEHATVSGGNLTITGTLGRAGGTLTLDDAADHLVLAKGGTLAGSVALGGGDDTFTLASGASLAGTVHGGAGRNTAVLDASSGDVEFDGDRVQGFGAVSARGSGTVQVTGGVLTTGSVALGDASLTVAENGSLVTTAMTAGDGANRLTVKGSISGHVALGRGDDQLLVAAGAHMTGSVDAGAGNDTLEIASSGTDAAPTAYAGDAFRNFETARFTAGVTALTGSFATSLLSVDGGRLVGLAGSAIRADHINVAHGATFGSAGTVTGSLAVAGTLSPGASPDTMTVDGNVQLATGSTTLFELTPTISDQLLISGTLTIAPGSTLTLTGVRPITPGHTLDLIVANGGIDGSFDTIIKPDTIFGVVSERGDRIELLQTFGNDPAFSGQVRGAIDAVNAVLVAGQASGDLVDALPKLLTATNGSDPHAFAEITPEPYATAAQIGVENGLSLVSATRGREIAADLARPGAYTFAQGVGSWRRIDGSSADGVSDATISNHGLLGGFGWSNGTVGGGVFTGYLRDHQSLASLPSRTDLDATIVGVQGGVHLGSFDLDGTVGYAGGKQTTTRTLPGGGETSGHGMLSTWVADLSGGYNLALGENWSIGPTAGVTFIRTHRAGLDEQGGGAFALHVDGDDANAWFANGGIRIEGRMLGSSRLRPYVELGVRDQVSGRDAVAVAQLAGTTIDLTAQGVKRARLLGTAAGGAALELGPQITLYANYKGEFGDGHLNSVNGGLGFRF